MEIKNGDHVRDPISGFFGTVTGIATYLHEAPSARVERAAMGSQEYKVEWLPVARLTVVGAKKPAPKRRPAPAKKAAA